MNNRMPIWLLLSLFLTGCGPSTSDGDGTNVAKGSSGKNDVMVEWPVVDLPTIVGYHVYRDFKCVAGVELTTVIATAAQKPAPNYEDKGIPNSQRQVCYEITAIDSVAGESAHGPRVTVTW